MGLGSSKGFGFRSFKPNSFARSDRDPLQAAASPAACEPGQSIEATARSRSARMVRLSKEGVGCRKAREPPRSRGDTFAASIYLQAAKMVCAANSDNVAGAQSISASFRRSSMLSGLHEADCEIQLRCLQIVNPRAKASCQLLCRRQPYQITHDNASSALPLNQIIKPLEIPSITSEPRSHELSSSDAFAHALHRGRLASGHCVAANGHVWLHMRAFL